MCLMLFINDLQQLLKLLLYYTCTWSLVAVDVYGYFVKVWPHFLFDLFNTNNLFLFGQTLNVCMSQSEPGSGVQ